MVEVLDYQTTGHAIEPEDEDFSSQYDSEARYVNGNCSRVTYRNATLVPIVLGVTSWIGGKCNDKR